MDSSGRGETISCPACNREILIPLDGEVVEGPVQDTSLANMMAAGRGSLNTERRSVELDKIRNSARLAVEDHWRHFLTLVHIDRQAALKSVYGFDSLIREMTVQMPEPDATIFKQIVEAERTKLADEYDRNPDALKARLGLTTSMPHYMPSFHRQSMDEMIVRTVVRATIWESVWAIFRLFR